MMLYFILATLLAATLAILLWPVWREQALPCRQRLWLSAAAALVFGAAAFGLYYNLGAPQIVPLLKQREAKMQELKAMIVKRSADVKANPDNLPAWLDLGESFMETSQYEAAANAFRRGVVLSKGDPQIIIAYAQAQIAAADGKVTDEAKKSIEMALLQQPDNALARYYMAVRELQDGKMDDAMRDMKALYHSLPADSPLKATIDQQIGRK